MNWIFSRSTAELCRLCCLTRSVASSEIMREPSQLGRAPPKWNAKKASCNRRSRLWPTLCDTNFTAAFRSLFARVLPPATRFGCNRKRGYGRQRGASPKRSCASWSFKWSSFAPRGLDFAFVRRTSRFAFFIRRWKRPYSPAGFFSSPTTWLLFSLDFDAHLEMPGKVWRLWADKNYRSSVVLPSFVWASISISTFERDATVDK